jgi:hypothetical protein
MKILEFLTPIYHFTYQTSLQAEEVKVNLKNSLTPKDTKLPSFSIFNKVKSYEGEVWEDKFEIVRRKKGRKDKFPPTAKGSIKENQTGTELIVEIRTPKYIQIILFIFFILLITDIILVAVFMLIPLRKESIYVALFFAIPFAFGFLPNYFNAKSEIKELSKDLKLFVEGKSSK